MNRLTCVHLCDDFALGGVSKGFALHAHPDLVQVADSRVDAVSPGWRMAKHMPADVIVTHFPPSWRTLPYLASLRLRNRHARLVHVEHSYTASWEARKVGSRRRFRAMLRICLGIFDEVVAVSHAQGAWLADAAKIPAARMYVNHPWSGRQALDAVPAVSAHREGPIVLGAIGRFSEQKGFDTLIRAMALLEPGRFTLKLAGFGEEEALLRSLAEGMTNVEFVGKVTDVARFMAGCDAVVVPSRWEAFGQVVAEAKMAGRAVVVADIDGMPEQVGTAGLVADCSAPDTLAAAIAWLETQALDQVGAAGRSNMANAEPMRNAAWLQLFQRARRETPRPFNASRLPGRMRRA